MKYITVVCDGMSDRPSEMLGGKTPLEVADKPNLDLIAEKGSCGLLKTIYDDMPADSGVANLGNRPTFEAGHSVEVHLFGFDGDLYGKRMRIGFAERIRGEQKFDGLETLKQQIDRDCDEAENALQRTRLELARWI